MSYYNYTTTLILPKAGKPNPLSNILSKILYPNKEDKPLNYDKPIFQHTITLHHGEEIYRHGNTPKEAKSKAMKYNSELRKQEYIEIISEKTEKVVNTGMDGGWRNSF